MLASLNSSQHPSTIGRGGGGEVNQATDFSWHKKQGPQNF